MTSLEKLRANGPAVIATLETYHGVMFANGRQMITVQDSREFIDELKKTIYDELPKDI